MELIVAREAPERKDPAPQHLHLGDGNYAGAIRQALRILPVEVRIDRFLVLEQDGQPPRVRLSLTILGEKEGSVSGRVLSYSPQSKGYVLGGAEIKSALAGSVKVAGQGVVENVTALRPGSAVLSQRPIMPIGVGPVVKRWEV